MTNTDLSQIQVLVVEDNELQRKILVKILNALHVGGIIQAANGEEALKVLEAFVPDLIITDSRMEPVSGMELARKIRHSEGAPHQTVPMIMLSVEGYKDEVRGARDAGIEDFMVKPVRPEALRDRIIERLSNPLPFIRCDNYVGPCRRRYTDKPAKQAHQNRYQQHYQLHHQQRRVDARNGEWLDRPERRHDTAAQGQSNTG